jgi:hypothetical protein
MGDRVNAWRNRMIREMLGQGYELWDLARPKAAVHDRLAQKAAKIGRDYDDEDIAYMLVDHLLDEVLNAAEGIERSFDAMKLDARDAQSKASGYLASHRSDPLPERHHWTEPSTVDVWFEFIDMLIWTRTLQDRIERRGMGGDPEQGLLPALAPGSLKRGVASAFQEFKDGHAAEARHLTNYGVHAGLLPNPGTPLAEVRQDGSLFFVMPDQITTPIDHWQEFSFSQQRDALAFADELFSQVVTFVDLVLDAFRDAVPARFRPGATDSAE